MLSTPPSPLPNPLPEVSGVSGTACSSVAVRAVAPAGRAARRYGAP